MASIKSVLIIRSVNPRRTAVRSSVWLGPILQHRGLDYPEFDAAGEQALGYSRERVLLIRELVPP
jgi:hypothetical protein